jgi:hypothetical protein
MGTVEALGIAAAAKTSGLSSLDAALISGAAGILGAVVGGLFTVGGLWIAESRRRKEARVGAFAVLGAEAWDALDLVYKVRAKDTWPIACNRSWTETWRSVRGAILTNPAESDVMDKVTQAFTSIDELQHAVNEPDGGRSLEPRDRMFLLDKQQLLENALRELKKPPPDKPPELQDENLELLREQAEAEAIQAEEATAEPAAAGGDEDPAPPTALE